MQRIIPNVDDWRARYWTDEDLDVVYKRLIDCLLEEVSRGSGVGSVIYGHPLFFDDVHMQLRKISKKRGFQCVTLPGISSLDTLSIDLGVDYGEGLQVFEANDLVENSVIVNPELHTLIFQIGGFGLYTASDPLASGPDRFKKIQRYLLRFYSPQQRIVIAFSDPGDGEGSILLRSRLNRLSSHHRRMFVGTTLYIPPAEL